MVFNKVRWILVITACLITTVISVIYQYSLTRLAYTLGAVVLIFGLLGTIIQNVINRNFHEAMESSDEDEAMDDVDENEDTTEEEINATAENDTN